MKKHFLIIAIFILCLPLSGNSQTSTITGYLFNDKDKPDAGIEVLVNGSSAVTLADGKFTVELKSAIRPGTAVIISVEKQGWSVLTPFMGKQQIQNKETNSDPLPITIAPKKSPRFLEPNKLSDLVAAMQIAATTLQLSKSSKSEIEAAVVREKEKVLEEYAHLSGFQIAEIRSALQEWSTITRGLGNRDEALQAYSNREFNRSGYLFLEAGRDTAAVRNRLKKELENSHRETIDAYMRSGASFLEGSQFKEALASFDELEKYFETGEISKELFKNQWLALKGSIGRTKWQFSYLAKKDEAIRLLRDGIDDFTKALNSSTHHQFLDKRARLQYDLGLALTELGNRSNSNISSLKLAVQAFKDAAMSGDRLHRLGNYDWQLYLPQISLGLVWTKLGERSKGKESVDYLNKALDAFDTAEKLVKREEDLFSWADLNSNLGRAYSELARRTDDPIKTKNYLNKATAAYEEEATAYTALLDRNLVTCSPCAGPTLISLSMAQMQLGENTSDQERGLEYLNKALGALDKASRLIKRHEDPFNWASLNANLGRAFSDLGNRMSDPIKREDYFSKSAAAYEAAYSVQSEGPCSSCVGSTLISLGIARTQLAENVSSQDEASDSLNKALEAFDKAEPLITHDEDPMNWASLKANVGRAFLDLAEAFKRDDPTRREGYLNKALSAYREAATVYSLEETPQDWVSVRLGLASAYFELQNWTGALEESNRVLQAFPDDSGAYRMKLAVLHDGRYEFEAAFILNKEWLSRHPEDSIAQYDLAEKLFTTGRFAECKQHVDSLLSKSDVLIEIKMALQVIEVGCLLGTSPSKEVSSKLDMLIAEAVSQPSNFKVTWLFNGTRHFIRQNQKLAPYRVWADTLFAALDLNHEEMLKALRESKANFKH